MVARGVSVDDIGDSCARSAVVAWGEQGDRTMTETISGGEALVLAVATTNIFVFVKGAISQTWHRF